MATEAFALSPMSARAAEPNEQDYEAIREAFMETARGRWFLGEYAKRNRNADTRMVLDAVAKIEETLAAQRQPIVEDRLPEALAAIRRAVADAETSAARAFDPAAIEAGISPIHRGVRIIREISWRWREIGADGRICDLIDSQLSSIESACAQVSTIDPRADLKAAFDLLKDRIEQTDVGATSQAASPPSPAPARTESPSSAETASAAATFSATAGEAPAADAASAVAEAAMDAAMEPEIAAERHAAFEEVAESTALADVTDEFSLDAAAEAEDEAVLERIAMEMAAADPDFDELVEPVEITVTVPAPMDVEIAAMVPEPIAPEPIAAMVAEEPADDAPIAMESLARLTDAIAEAAAEVMEQPVPAMAAAATATFAAVPTATLPMPSPLPEASLGATILASGILQKPRAPANDPLAPIRRMTQAEKIAFFS
ncbi:hypothetical protein [Bradyrhizobium sp.]|uniref:hypothetical protein n=1 Tax=Bradyrhizobium sp. TaxID=376 RepID=UPI0039E3E2A8